MIESVAGFMSAAPAPWSTRAAISSSPESARPHQSEALVNTAMPMTKISRRPYASATLPPISISAANVSAYPVTIHCSDDRSVPRSRWIDGRATFTTVLSSMIMKRPKETAASVNHLRVSSAKIRALIQPPRVVSEY